mmetsp:Transcript_13257/g.11730  ORF Transcript_13257/g.11730 Transcript_13257/m.11730 type:complete len:91 (-) Transcript_13257:206-478(-)
MKTKDTVLSQSGVKPDLDKFLSFERSATKTTSNTKRKRIRPFSASGYVTNKIHKDQDSGYSLLLGGKLNRVLEFKNGKLMRRDKRNIFKV